MQKTILVINGPGLSDTELNSDRYGRITLSTISSACKKLGDDLEIQVDFRQTEDQQELLSWLSKNSSEADAVVVNPAGFSQADDMDFGLYCGAVHKLAKLKKPIIEVHLCNIYSHDVDVTLPQHEPGGEMGFISGFGVDGYLLAIRSLAEKLKD